MPASDLAHADARRAILTAEYRRAMDQARLEALELVAVLAAEPPSPGITAEAADRAYLAVGRLCGLARHLRDLPF